MQGKMARSVALLFGLSLVVIVQVQCNDSENIEPVVNSTNEVIQLKTALQKLQQEHDDTKSALSNVMDSFRDVQKERDDCREASRKAENEKLHMQLFGSKLAKIESKEEDDFITEHATENQYLLGGTDMLVEGRWAWYDENEEMSYTNWHSAEPNNKNNEDCLITRMKGYLWNDASCNDSKYFICEQVVAFSEK